MSKSLTGAAAAAAVPDRDPRGAWLSKEAAASRAGVSVRSIERLISDGKLRTRLQRESGRKPRVLVCPEDVDGLDSARSLAPLPAAGAQLAPAGGAQLAPLVDQLASALASSVRPNAELKPWLTIDEAVEWSGLPRGWLLARARAGAAFALNVGSGRRAVWRFSVEGLRRAC